jgi:pimeloyl-ACP methyl ester carboxylesterase
MLNAGDFASSSDETPVYFQNGEATLFGILTKPTTGSNGIVIVTIPGGGTPLSMHVNRLSVKLCRRVASAGFHAFRFDYHGVGESFGETDRFDLAQPFVSDLEGAIAWLSDNHIKRHVLVGSCFGARTVMATAAKLRTIDAVALICPPLRDFVMGEQVITRFASELSLVEFAQRAANPTRLAKLVHRDSRATYAALGSEKIRSMLVRRNETSAAARYQISPGFLHSLGTLAELSIPTLFVFGKQDDFLAEFQRAKSGPLGPILRDRRANISVEIVPGRIHGFQTMDAQDHVLDLVSTWLVARSAGA